MALLNIVYVIWDEKNGYDMSAVYRDKKSAEFVLRVKYSDYWRISKQAKVEALDVISMEDFK